MISCAGVQLPLESVGQHISGPGGADTPLVIPERFLLFELITAGAVYLRDGNDLHGMGAVFVYNRGQSTVSWKPWDRY